MIASDHLRRIALTPTPQSRYLTIDIARTLKSDYSSEIHMYCARKEDLQYYRSIDQDGLFSSLNQCADLHTSHLSEIDASTLQRAQSWEARLGIGYSFLAVANRHVGRGFALTGSGHPRSRISEETSNQKYLSACNRFFDYWDNEILDKGLTLFIAPPHELAYLARARGIPIRYLSGAKHKNLHYWGEDEYRQSRMIERRYNALKDEPIAPVKVKDAYSLAQTISKKYLDKGTVSGMLMAMSQQTLRRIYWKLRSYEKATNGYYLLDELKFIARIRRDFKTMTSQRLPKLADLKGARFVLFPLQTDPEMSLQGMSPEFFFQHAAIAAIARDLPAGVQLVVKESIVGVGRRPRGFYEAVADLKNVVWLNMLEAGIDAVRASAAVATISGTPGFEAAVNGIPVLTFGKHNLYNMLPHVYQTSDIGNLSSVLNLVLSGVSNDSAARVEGTRFLRAVEDCSVDLMEHSHLNLKGYDSSVVTSACRLLNASLLAA